MPLFVELLYTYFYTVAFTPYMIVPYYERDHSIEIESIGTKLSRVVKVGHMFIKIKLDRRESEENKVILAGDAEVTKRHTSSLQSADRRKSNFRGSLMAAERRKRK